MKPNNKYGLDESLPRWFAVYLRYKREKVVHESLLKKGIESYLPLQQFTRHYTRKIRVVNLPLISCYIFVRITKKNYVPVLETPDVVNFVRFSNELIAIPEDEIKLIQRILGEGIEVEAESNAYQEGDVVEIIGGNLTGIRGILLHPDNKKNFQVELTHTGYSLRMQVDRKLLRKLRPNGKPAKIYQ